MLDMKFLRTNPDIVKENIKKKFQDEKLPLVDEVIELDKETRDAKHKGDQLRAQVKRKVRLTGAIIGKLKGQGMSDEEAQKAAKDDPAFQAIMAEVAPINQEIAALETKEAELQQEIKKL